MENNVVAISKPRLSADVLMQVRSLLEAKTVSAAQIAKEISVSPATLSQILNDGYKADPSKMIKKLDSWLTLREEKASSPIQAPKFVMTRTAKQILDDISYAHSTSDIACIYGASGVGKSQALRHYQKNNNNVWMVTISPSVSSLVGCLYEIAMELGMNDVPRRKDLLGRAIKKRLLGTEGVVIIDEADHLKYDALEELRAIQEYAEIGMVLVGNNTVYTQLTGGRRNEDFARLFSRIGKKRGIHKTKQADVRAIAEAWNIVGKDEFQLMLQISEKAGGLRLLTKTLKLAAMFTKGSNINEQALRAAFNELDSND